LEREKAKTLTKGRTGFRQALNAHHADFLRHYYHYFILRLCGNFFIDKRFEEESNGEALSNREIIVGEVLPDGKETVEEATVERTALWKFVRNRNNTKPDMGKESKENDARTY
jgi:hypothetical protein